MKNSEQNIIIILLGMALLGISPSRRIRKSDNWGSGAFGASRGNRPHLGIDLVYSPDEQVRAPFAMSINRVSYPYASSLFSGIAFTTTSNSIDYDGRLWYFEPNDDIIGKTVRKGQVLGFAQQINSKYPGMINHLHLQLQKTNAKKNEDDIEYDYKIFADPRKIFMI